MPRTHYAALFFGGMFFVNALPHFISGVMGRPFQSPFAKPPGQAHRRRRVGGPSVTTAILVSCGGGAVPSPTTRRSSAHR